MHSATSCISEMSTEQSKSMATEIMDGINRIATASGQI